MCDQSEITSEGCYRTTSLEAYPTFLTYNFFSQILRNWISDDAPLQLFFFSL